MVTRLKPTKKCLLEPPDVGGAGEDSEADEGAKEKGGSRGMGNPGTVEPEEEEPPGAAGDDE